MPLIWYQQQRTTQPQGAAQYAPQWRGRALTGLLAGQTVATDGSAVTTVGTVTRGAYGGGKVSGGLASVHSSSIRRAVIAGSTLGTGTAGASLLVVFRTTTTATGAYLAGLGSESGGSGNTIFALWTGGGSAAELQGVFGGSSVNGVIASSGSVINDGRVHCAMLTLSDFSGGAGRSRLYIDGVRVAGDSGSTPGNANLYSTIVAGGFRRGAADFTGADCQIFLCQPLAGEIPEPEALALTSNPWQLFAPSERRIWVPSAGGPQASTGGSSAAVSVTAAGAGTAVEYASGGASASVAVTAAGAGAGALVATGGAGASVSVTASGAGTAALQASGGASAAVSLSAAGAGAGAEVASGGASASVTTTAAGAGSAAGADSGGASASVSVTAAGSGTARESASGGAGSSVSVSAAGAGTGASGAAGGASAAVLVTASGAGLALEIVAGGSSARVAISAAGAGTSSEADADETYPLAGVAQPYPMTATQAYPLAGAAQTYPLQ